MERLVEYTSNADNDIAFFKRSGQLTFSIMPIKIHIRDQHRFYFFIGNQFTDQTVVFYRFWVVSAGHDPEIFCAFRKGFF